MNLNKHTSVEGEINFVGCVFFFYPGTWRSNSGHQTYMASDFTLRVNLASPKIPEYRGE